MLKPIVSMNQMAMNESIATTCCYVWNGTSLLGSASLPHGGQLVAGSKTAYYTWNGAKTEAKEINKSWLKFSGHVTPAYASYTYNPSDSQGANVAFAKVMKGADVLDLYDEKGNLNTAIATGGFCTHNSSDCWYTKETSFDKTFTHTGATSAHYNLTGGNIWLADHTAVQYSS